MGGCRCARVNGNIWSANRGEWRSLRGGTRRSGQQSLITWMSSFCLVALGGSSGSQFSALLRFCPGQLAICLGPSLCVFSALCPQYANNVRLLCVLFCVRVFTVQVSVLVHCCILDGTRKVLGREGKCADIYWKRCLALAVNCVEQWNHQNHQNHQICDKYNDLWRFLRSHLRFCCLQVQNTIQLFCIVYNYFLSVFNYSNACRIGLHMELDCSYLFVWFVIMFY